MKYHTVLYFVLNSFENNIVGMDEIVMKNQLILKHDMQGKEKHQGFVEIPVN